MSPSKRRLLLSCLSLLLTPMPGWAAGPEPKPAETLIPDGFDPRGKPFRALPLSAIEPNRFIKAEDYKPLYCLRWSDGCDECVRSAAGSIECQSKPTVMPIEHCKRPVTITGLNYTVCEPVPATAAQSCERRMITCDVSDEPTLKYYCEIPIRTKIGEYFEQEPALTILSKDLVITWYDPDIGGQDLHTHWLPSPPPGYDGKSLVKFVKDTGKICKNARSKFNTVDEIKAKLGYDIMIFPSEPLFEGK